MLKRVPKKFILVFVVLAIVLASCGLYAANALINSNENDTPIKSILQSSSYVYVGDSQMIAVEFNDHDSAVESEIVYHKQDGPSCASSAIEVNEEYAIYELPFTDNCQAGLYTLDYINNREGQIKIEKNEERGYSFAVGESNYNLSEDDFPAEVHDVSNPEFDEVVGLDNSTQMLMTKDAVASKDSYDPNNPNGFIVALDAGHGGSDPGACYGGWAEKDLNWSITQYCGWELCSYSGVRVLLARNGDEYVGLKERVDRAKNAGSNIFVCIHNNAGGGHGAEVWIQHDGGWHSELSWAGASIGNSILEKLSARLGLRNNGLKSRYCTDGSTYPDGTIGDYFTVLYWARVYCMPAILVEHAFMDSGGVDSVVFTEEGRKTMGIADADALAEYYGFYREPRPYIKDMTDGSITLAWNEVEGAEKYAVTEWKGGYHTIDANIRNLEYKIDNLVNGETHQYLVQSYKNGQWSSGDLSLLITCKLAPRPIVSVDSVGDGTVTLKWKNMDNCTQYSVYEIKGQEAKCIDYTIRSKQDYVTYQVNNLANGYDHVFSVQSYCNSQWSDFDINKYKTAKPIGRMNPYNLKAKASTNTIDLSWERPPGIEQYSIYTKAPDSGWVNQTFTETSNHYVIHGLKQNTKYEITVIAYAMGYWSSFDEAEKISCSTEDIAPIVHVKDVGDGTATLEWEQVKGAIVYALIEFYPSGEGRYIDNHFLSSKDVIEYKIDNLANGYEHTFLVQSCVGGVWSSMTDKSKYCYATPKGPMSPYGIVVEPGAKSINVSWKGCAGAEQYSVYTRKLGQEWINHTYTLHDCFYTINNLTPNTQYEITVIAYVYKKWTGVKEVAKVNTVDVGPLVRAKDIGDGTVTLQWNKILDSDCYAIIEYYPNGSGRYVAISDFKMAGNIINYKIDDLANGYEHVFLVQSCVDGEWSSMTDTSKFCKVTPIGPMKPLNLKGIPNSNSIYLTWDKCSGAVQYSVYSRTKGHGWVNHSYTVTSNYYTITNLSLGTEYEIFVIAYVYNKWTTDPEIIKVSTVETRPTPKVISEGNGTVTLQWDKINNASKYSVKEIFNHDRDNFKIIDDDFRSYESKVQYVISDLANGFKHEFFVQAYVNGVWSEWELTKCCTGIPQGPVRPYETKVVATGYNRLDVTWRQIPGAVYYGVWSRSTGSSWTVHDYTITGNSYSIEGIKGGKKYDIVVVVYLMDRWISYENSDIVQGTPNLDPNRPCPVVTYSSNNTATLTWNFIPNASQYGIYSKNADGNYTCYSYTIKDCCYSVNNLQPGIYHFLVRAWFPSVTKWSDYDDGDLVDATVTGLYYNPIMYSPRCSIDQMVRCFNSTGHTFPSNIYANKGAKSIKEFCEIAYNEAVLEGVEPSVLFCQCMLETGWFTFGGQVRPEQCNFGGIGATDGGASGAEFPNVQTGLRAQVQHLKAYASTAPLNNPCVDPRFEYVTRGCAPNVENLGNGYWASSPTYAANLINLMSRLFQS